MNGILCDSFQDWVSVFGQNFEPIMAGVLGSTLGYLDCGFPEARILTALASNLCTAASTASTRATLNTVHVMPMSPAALAATPPLEIMEALRIFVPGLGLMAASDNISTGHATNSGLQQHCRSGRVLGPYENLHFLRGSWGFPQRSPRF